MRASYPEKDTFVQKIVTYFKKRTAAKEPPVVAFPDGRKSGHITI
jgi:hypothetical protein